MPHSASRYRFGPFVLDTVSARLLRDGAPITLQPKVHDLLAYLVDHRGELVSHDDLLVTVWGDTVVTPSSVFQIVRKARQALGDDARRPRWIETVQRKGYRFIGEVNATGATEALFGRSAVLASLRAAFDAGERTVVLVGPGGIGKTTLARAVLAAGGRGWFLDLTAAEDRSDVATSLARALGVPIPSGRGAAVERMARPLAGAGPGLVVLDNAEHLSGPVSETVALWGARCPHSTFLITSRVALDIPGAKRMDLGPLAVHAAAEMLRACVRRRDPERAASLSPSEVVAVVEALDGVPLALQLAAGKLLVVNGTELAAALPARTALLRSHQTDLSDRHRSLDATLQWSWEQLPPMLRRALVQLAAFRGPVSTSLAERALAPVVGDEDPLEVLADLHDRSWIQTEPAEGGATVRVLLPLQGFVRGTPEARDVWAEAIDIHRAVVLDAVPPWSTTAVFRASADPVLRGLAGELAALTRRTAPVTSAWARAATALAMVRHADGLAAEALAVLEPADPSAYGRRVAGRVHLLRSQVLKGAGDVDRRLEEARRAFEAARAAGERDDARLALLLRATCWIRLGDSERAESLARVAVEGGAEDALAAYALAWIATILLRTHAGDARSVARRALKLALRLRDPGIVLEARQTLASCLNRLGQLEEANRELRLALRLAHEVGNPVEIVGVTGNVAKGLMEVGRTAEALPLARWAVTEARRLGDANLLGFMACFLGSLLGDMGDVTPALALHDEAIAAFESMPHPAAAVGAGLALGLTLMAADRLESAHAELSFALRRGHELQDPVIEWRARYYLSISTLLGGRPAEAETHASSGLALLTVNDGDIIRASGLIYRAAARALQGRMGEARADLDEARPLLVNDHTIAPYRRRLVELLVLEARETARQRLRRLSEDSRVTQSQELRVLARVVHQGLGR